jgi:SOS-response transcriptional repressor LexA
MNVGETLQIYRDLMRFKPEDLTPNAWAVKAGVSRTVWADMRRHGNPSRRTLEKLLTAAGSTLAEFEALRIGNASPQKHETSGLADGATSWGGAQHPPLPLLATALAGEWDGSAAGIALVELRTGEIVDRTSRPASLANDASAYAITVVAESMWPRFRPGRRVAVSPKAPVAVGDDVLVKLKAPAAHGDVVLVLLGEFVRRQTRRVELRQFHPDTAFHVDAAEISALEKIAGELI